jgi:exopolyphosphatase / guanosine-5'-triphosphate,3'-diphosphate pyrophosphatase
MTSRAGTRPTSPRPVERWAALDIGSDTVHLLVADVQRGTAGRVTVRQVAQRSMLLELGREVASRGRFGRASTQALKATVRRFVAVARRYDARLIVSATEAAREAANGPAVLSDLQRATGTPPRILSGQREAALGFLAVRSALPASGVHLLVDSGGASTETSLVTGRRLTASTSLPVGAALLAASVPGDPPRPLPWALAAIRIAGVLGAAPVGRPTRMFATGGTAHNLAGLDGDRKGHPAALPLSIAQLDKLTARLLREPAAKIAHASGEDPRRVMLLAPGALVLGAIAQHYGLEAMTVLPEGVRDGMIIAAARDPDSWWEDTPGHGEATDA